MTEAIKAGMKFHEAGESEIPRLLADENWAFEQKMDGTRVLARITSLGVDFFQSGGKPLTHSAAVQHLPQLEATLSRLIPEGVDAEFILDGELLIRTGELFLFDVPHARSASWQAVTASTEFYLRREFLERVVAPEVSDGGLVTLVPHARGTEHKRRFFEEVRDSGAEGIVAKSLGGVYLPGQRTRHSLKVKFVKTADVIVTAVNRPDPKHGNFEFGIYGNTDVGEPGIIPLGKCSAIGKPDAKVGDVIEVAYLYREPSSGGLVQPRMTQIRHDKKPAECTIEQFPAYSREPVHVSPF